MDREALVELARERMVAALRRQHATVKATVRRGGDWMPAANLLALDLVLGDPAAAAAARETVRSYRGRHSQGPDGPALPAACDPARLVDAALEEQRLAEAALALGERAKPEVKGRGRKRREAEDDLRSWEQTQGARKRLRAAPPPEERVRAAADRLEDPHLGRAGRWFLPLNDDVQLVCFDRGYGQLYGISPLLQRARAADAREHALDYAFGSPPALAVLAARALELMLKQYGHRAVGEHLTNAQWRACLPREGELAAADVHPLAVEMRYRNADRIHAFLELARVARERLRLPLDAGMPALTPLSY